MRILLDVDGVLADFWGGIVRAHRLEVDPYTLDKWRGHYGGHDVLGITQTNFWKPCNHEFWLGLEPYPECHEIVAMCEAAVGIDNVCLLTSPSLAHGCMSGKSAWIERHLKNYRRRFLIGAPKTFCARWDSVLIDDSQDNTTRFLAAGGHAIVYPGPWNVLHRVTDKLAYLKEQIQARHARIHPGSIPRGIVMLIKFTNVEDCCCYYSGTAVVSVTPGGDVDVQSVCISKAECKVAKIPAFTMLPNSEEHWRQLERYVANELEYRDDFVERCKLQAQAEAYA